MKKLFKGIALGVMFALSTASFAGNGDKPAAKLSMLPYLDTDYSVLSVANLSAKSGVFYIMDKSGDVLYKEWISKEDLVQKVLDFSYLKDGEYEMVLKVKGTEAARGSFSVVDKKIKCEGMKPACKKEMKAFANLVDNTLYVSHLSFGSKEFKLSIYRDGEGTVFYKTIEAKDFYSGKFDVSELPKGNYVANINSGDKEYNYAFKK